MQNEPLISVIVPVYKVEPYLDRCVQSIVDQTYKNLEIILVDDGSPDNCPAMCDAWAEQGRFECFCPACWICARQAASILMLWHNLSLFPKPVKRLCTGCGYAPKQQ